MSKVTYNASAFDPEFVEKAVLVKDSVSKISGILDANKNKILDALDALKGAKPQ